MPSYEYSCPSCGWKGTLYQVSIAARDEQVCDQTPGYGPHTCGVKLVRVEIPEASDLIIDTKGGYESAVIMRSGQKVAGEFGRQPGRRRGFNQRAKR